MPAGLSNVIAIDDSYHSLALTTGGTPASAPVITTQPQNQSVYAGGSASFSAAASGEPAPTVQWQVSANGGTTWADIAGATASPLTFAASLYDDGSQYRAVFTNSAGSATSDAATLTVKPPLFLEQLPKGEFGIAADASKYDLPNSAADQFRVLEGEKLAISEIQIWGAYWLDQPYTDDFTVIFHKERADTPALPGISIYTEDPAAFTREATGIVFGMNQHEYLYTLTLSQPLVLTAGLYWIEVFNNDAANPGANQSFFFWEEGNPDTSGHTGARKVASANQAPGSDWVSDPVVADLALRVIGDVEQVFTWSPANPQQGELVTFYIPAGATQTVINWSVACNPGQDPPWTEDYCSQALGQGNGATRTFEKAGDWWVTLNMENADTTGWIQQVQLVTVANVPPVVSDNLALWSPSEPPTPPDPPDPPDPGEPSWVGQEVFAAASVQYAEAGATCTVDYGDGSGAQTGTLYGDMVHCTGPSHTYAAPGEYEVTMEVKDPDGKSGSRTTNHVVYEVLDPQVVNIGVFSAPETPAEPSFVGQAVVAVAMVAYADETATCTVNYGDGAGAETGTFYPGYPGACVGPFHSYTAAGSYSIEVIVTNPGNKTGSASATHQVVAQAEGADLSVTMATNAAPKDKTITFESVVANAGPWAAEKVVYENSLPAGTAFVKATATQGKCNMGKGKVLTCSIGTMEPGASVNVTLVLKRKDFSIDIVNIATVSSATEDPDMSDNLATATVGGTETTPAAANLYQFYIPLVSQ